MAADVQRRGHGSSLEGLSVIAGAAHLLPPDAAATKNNAQAASLRASYQRYVGVSSAAGDSTGNGQLAFRMQRSDSYGPKLVQGDYTYTTARKMLTLSSLCVGGGSLPPPSPNPAVPPPRGSIPAMMPSKASATNTAAWKAYGSPSARTHHNRPPLASAAAQNTALQPLIAQSGKLPRVAGFKPRRPASAPSASPDEVIRPVVAAINSTSSFSSANKRLAATASASITPVMVDVGVLAVDLPDPLMYGKTDTGRVMFEHTLPTDPYSKMVWEEQSRKARANMARHAAAMAAAAAIHGGMSHSSGGGSVAGSRPVSARRGAASPTDCGSSTGSGGGGRGTSATAMRPRFSSLALSDLARQGTDHKPPTVVGFVAPDLTEDTTMPGPGDPRWAYTRLGRTQIERLQNSLKYTIPHPPARPASAPAVGIAASGADGAASGASPRREASQPAPATSEHFTAPGQTVPGSGSVTRVGDLEQQRSVQFSRTASGSGGQARPGSAGLARPGSAGFARSGSGSGPVKRPGSAGIPRPGSAGGSTVLAVETSSGVPLVPGVRGASAGRTRETAPNPRVDLRAYLAEATADAEEDDDGTEMLMHLGDMTEEAAAAAFLLEGMDGAAGPSLPVPADQLAARLAEMVAAVAVVAAQQQQQQQQTLGEEGDGGMLMSVSMGGGAAGRPPPVVIEEVVDEGEEASAREAATNSPDAAGEQQPQMADMQVGTEFQGLQTRSGVVAISDDALAALHGASDFGRGPGRYGSLLAPEYANRASVLPVPAHDTDDSEASGAEDGGPEPEQEPFGLGLGLGLGLGSRSGRGARPTSARPVSARSMSVRPGSAMPGSRNRNDGLTREGGLGGIEGGMDVIMEQSEGGVGED